MQALADSDHSSGRQPLCSATDTILRSIFLLLEKGRPGAVTSIPFDLTPCRGVVV
jgi:hypothetical protein